jgi:hypothetical protein
VPHMTRCSAVKSRRKIAGPKILPCPFPIPPIIIGGFGRPKASMLVQAYPMTRKAIVEELATPKKIIDTLYGEYQEVHPDCHKNDIEHLARQILTALQARRP